MRTILKKNILIAILAGTILFSGGAMIASADQAADTATANSLLSQLSCKDSWVTCIANVPMLIPLFIANALFLIASMLLTGASYIFDAVLAMSIDNVFLDQEFITTTWGIMLSFTNMVFIFILLYTGIQTILGFGNWQKTVLKVVIIALLINFSLFFTKVVIDAGNILAVGIYSAMGAPSTTPHTTGGSVQERDLSFTIASNFQPQTFMKISEAAKLSAMEITVIFVIGVLVNFFAALAFFRVAIVFIGRIIGFWFLMIVSPLAFISIALPKGEHFFQSWLKNLLGLSFVAPVFLFFLYVIMKILGSGGLLNSFLQPNTATVGTFTFDTIFIPTITVIFVYMALDKAVSLTKSMSGAFGELGAKIGGWVAGVTGGVALNGTAMLGRTAVGGLANKALGTGVLQRISTEGGMFARPLARMGVLAADKTRNATFDARNVGFVKSGLKTAGIDAGKGGKEGYVGVEKEYEKKKSKTAELYNLTDKEKEELAYTEALAKNKLMDSEKRLAEATSPEAKEEAQKTLDVAKEAHLKAEKNASKEGVAAANRVRREAYANATTRTHFYYTKKDQRKAAQKIREGTSADEKEKAKMLKAFKEMSKEVKEEEEKPVAEPKEVGKK